MWYVYLLTDGTRTYVGSTTDPARRLRQHNGELVGGARATRGRTWRLVGYISGIENRSSACRLERRVKHGARGLKNRYALLMEYGGGVCGSPQEIQSGTI